MKGHVFRTRDSKRDYDNIWRSIALDNIDAADRTVADFDRVAALLAQFPGMGQRRDDLQLGLRSFFTNARTTQHCPRPRSGRRCSYSL